MFRSFKKGEDSKMKIGQDKINEVAFNILRFCHNAIQLIRKGSRSYEDALVLLGILSEFVEDKSKASTIPPPPLPNKPDQFILVEPGIATNPEREQDDTLLLKD